MGIHEAKIPGGTPEETPTAFNASRGDGQQPDITTVNLSAQAEADTREHTIPLAITPISDSKNTDMMCIRFRKGEEGDRTLIKIVAEYQQIPHTVFVQQSALAVARTRLEQMNPEQVTAYIQIADAKIAARKRK